MTRPDAEMTEATALAQDNQNCVMNWCFIDYMEIEGREKMRKRSKFKMFHWAAGENLQGSKEYLESHGARRRLGLASEWACRDP